MTFLAGRPSEAPALLEPVTLRSLSEEVSERVLRPRAPRWWWIGFGISLSLLLTLIVATAWLFINGIGVWGVDVPVAWGLALPNMSGGLHWRAAARSCRRCSTSPARLGARRSTASPNR
jgi:hypothetical protein